MLASSWMNITEAHLCCFLQPGSLSVPHLKAKYRPSWPVFRGETGSERSVLVIICFTIPTACDCHNIFLR